MKLSANAQLVAKKKYLRRGDQGLVVENVEQWLERVARALSKAEKVGERSRWLKIFKEVMSNLEFLPGGRTLANAGTINNQLANCFVLPFEDNIEEIFASVKDAAILKKNGGGVGFSFSRIRPRGDLIAGTTGAACGPVALMKILDASSEILLQAGGRRSGNMVVLADNHPDVLEFITCKETDNQLQQINYSLGVSSEFMKAVEKDVLWNLINPRTGQTVNQIQAQTIFEMAASHAHKNGDPGLVFLDRINKDNPTPHTGRLEAVNLCGEQPLLAYEACNLGSVNLVKFIKGRRDHKGRHDNYGLLNKKGERQKTEMLNFQRLEKVVRIGVRMLDNVISVCRYPLPQVDRVVKSNRKIGLGVMGWADSLIKLGIAYDSEEALQLAEKVMKFIGKIGHDESKRLGVIRSSFPNFSGSLWQKKGYQSMRNATVTTIAPTGSISLIAGVSSGIEPLFALSFYRKVMGGTRLAQVNPELMAEMGRGDRSNQGNQEVMGKIMKRGSVQGMKGVAEKTRRLFVTAMDISADWHIKMQAAFQKYTDNAVSKTINLPAAATAADVRKAFMLAWRLGCKGITVYRDKSKGSQVLNVGEAGKGGDFNGAKCPECGNGLVIEEGCQKCYRCGFSGCEV